MLAALPEMWVAVGLVSVSAIRFLLFIQENDASPDTIMCDDRRPGWLSWPGDQVGCWLYSDANESSESSRRLGDVG